MPQQCFLSMELRKRNIQRILIIMVSGHPKTGVRGFMNETFFINENDFVFEGVNYERDTQNGRCYYREASRSLRSDCDGKMAMHRIGESWFLFYREKAMKKLGLKYKDIINLPQSN